MSEDTQRAWIEERLINSLPLAPVEADVEINNVKFKTRDGVPYLTYFILGGDGKQAELVQGGYERHVGVLQIDVLVPENTGTGDLSRLAAWATKLFSRESVLLPDNARLRFRVGSHTYLGVRDGLARRVVSVPYWRDEKQPV